MYPMTNRIPFPRLARIVAVGAIVTLGACVQDREEQKEQGAVPPSGVQRELASPLKAFEPAAPERPASAEEAAVPPPGAASPTGQTAPDPSRGIAGIAQSSATEGDPRIGRTFAIDNCRPCHVVVPSQGSAIRFANAPDFRAIANAPRTTPFSLIVWLTNPHPTMPSLVLLPQEATNVIAYIMSLRDARQSGH